MVMGFHVGFTANEGLRLFCQKFPVQEYLEQTHPETTELTEVRQQ